MTTGSDAILEILHELGVRHVFGNPGSTEAPFMHALSTCHGAPDYVLGLQEATVVGMADGYATVTRRPAFVNLHTVAGVGNGVGNLVNARSNRAPLVVTAGQPDLRREVTEPFLGGDPAALAEPAVKSARRVNYASEIAITLRSAFHEAALPPAGPVFVGLPMNVLDEETEPPDPPSIERAHEIVPASLDELIRLLLEPAPGKLAIVAGDEVVDSGAALSLVTFAERLGAPVYGAPLHGRGVFPPAHPLWKGTMPSTLEGIRKTLGAFDRALLLGGNVLVLYPYALGPLVADGVDLLQISSDARELGRAWGVRYATQGELAPTLERLVNSIDHSERDVGGIAAFTEARRTQREGEIEQREKTALKRYGATPMHPMAAVHGLMRSLPDDILVVDESVSAGVYVRGFHRPVRPGRYFFCRGGGLGWGMPAAVGISLGTGGEKVLCVVGDGSACYSPQALWTAAHRRLPVVFAVLDNSGYEILRGGLRERMGGNRQADLVGVDITGPGVDFRKLAATFGVASTHVDRADEIGDAIHTAMKSDEPQLVHIPISGI